MAFPVVAWLPALLTGVWSGLVSCFRWCVSHYHIVKIVLVCTLICTAFYFGRKVYVYFNQLMRSYLTQIGSSAPTSVSYSGSLLAKANYVLPVSEMFALFSVYVVFAGLCLTLKFIIMGYKAIPFKSA